MRSSNPVFSKIQKESETFVEVQGNTATYPGIAYKTLILLAITLISGFSSIFLPIELLIPIIIVSGFGSFILVLIGTMSMRAAAVCSILYAFFQGVTYGLLTYLLDYYVLPGIGIMAIGATASIFAVMLGLYLSGLLRASKFLYKFVIGSLLSIFLFSLVFLIISLANPLLAQSITDNFGLMVAISLFCILIGAFMLILNFDRADQTVKSGLPKAAEWQVGLALMVTIIWIYVEVLRLALIIASKK